MSDQDILEQDRQAILRAATPAHQVMFPEQPRLRDPMSLHVDRVATLPGTNPSILCGGLGGGVEGR